MSELAIGFCVASIILSVIALVGAIMAIAYVVGLKNSTHQLQILDPGASTGEDLAKEFDEVQKKMNEDGGIHV